MNKITLLFSQNPNKLFLVDFIGASITAILSGLVLPQFETLLGVPKQPLWILAGIAIVFAIYSFVCFLKLEKEHSTFIKIIAFANSVFIVITPYLLMPYLDTITIVGMLYFVFEWIIIALLILLELKVAATLKLK